MPSYPEPWRTVSPRGIQFLTCHLLSGWNHSLAMFIVRAALWSSAGDALAAWQFAIAADLSSFALGTGMRSRYAPCAGDSGSCTAGSSGLLFGNDALDFDTVRT